MIWPFRKKTPQDKLTIDDLDNVDIDQVECADLRERLLVRQAAKQKLKDKILADKEAEIRGRASLRANRIAEFRAWNRGISPEEAEAQREMSDRRPRWLRILHTALAQIVWLVAFVVLLPLFMVSFICSSYSHDPRVRDRIMPDFLAPLAKIPHVGRALYYAGQAVLWMVLLALWLWLFADDFLKDLNWPREIAHLLWNISF